MAEEYSTSFDDCTSLPPLLVTRHLTRHRSRHLMVDVFDCEPEDCDDPSNHEASLKLYMRFEKLIRYVKFYIKAKQKKVYSTPREREIDRLGLINEVLIFNLYMPRLGQMACKSDKLFHCKASEFQATFLFHTLEIGYETQDVKPDKASQLAQDVTRFYEEIFVPEGGVPLLQQLGLQQRSLCFTFSWVVAYIRSGTIVFYHSTVNLTLSSPKDNNYNNPDSEPTIQWKWFIYTTWSKPQDLVEFERFYDEKADGFPRHAKINKQNKLLFEQWKRARKEIASTQVDGLIARYQETVGKEESVQVEMVDKLEETINAVEKVASAKKEKEKAIESRVDESQLTQDVKESEVVEEELVQMGMADNLERTKAVEREVSVEREKEKAVGEFQGTGHITELEGKEQEQAMDELQKNRGEMALERKKKEMDRLRKTGDITGLEGKEKKLVMDEIRKAGDITELDGKEKEPVMDEIRKAGGVTELEGKEKEPVIDELRKTGGVTELEGKGKGLTMQSADKLQEKDDIGMEEYDKEQEDQTGPAVEKLQAMDEFDIGMEEDDKEQEDQTGPAVEKLQAMDEFRRTGDATELEGEGKGLAMESADKLQALDEFRKNGGEMALGRKEKEIDGLPKTGDIMEFEEKELAKDEFRKTGDVMGLEGKGKGLAMEKLQQKADTAMEDYEIKQEDQTEPAVCKVQEAGAFDLKVSKTEPKLCKLRETKQETKRMGKEVQTGRKAGRGGRKLRKGKGKTEPPHCEGLPENIESSIDHTNEVQLGDKNANARKKPKATPKQSANKKKKQMRNTLNKGMDRSSRSKDTSKRRGKR